MRWTDIVNWDDLKKTISVLKPDHQLFEVRVIDSAGKIISGYFTDAATLYKAFDSVSLPGCNVYLSINRINPALYSRAQHDKFMRVKTTTSDKEVDAYQWLFIDFDPVRPAGISSTDEELGWAEEMKETVKGYLHSLGFPSPVEALSGNGYHLLYSVDLKNNDENHQIIAGCLTKLSERFNNDKVHVDTTNANPSRICKLHGTLAQKGANTADRPHRMSRLLVVPDVIEKTGIESLQKLAERESQIATPSRPQSKPQKQISTEFDARDFLAQHGMTWKEEPGRDCQILRLDECPFDSNHKDGDSKVFIYSNGAIAFKCHHDSCHDKKWQDVRSLFDPAAYSEAEADARIEAGYQAYRKQKEEDIEINLGGEYHYESTGRGSRHIVEDFTDDDLEMHTLDEFEERTKEWLIPGYIPKGCVTLLCSDGGIGKTSVWCDTVSKLTQGVSTIFDKAQRIPFKPNEPCNVMYFSKEDSTEEVLKHKFVAAEADQSRIRAIGLDDPKINKVWYGSQFLEKLIEKYRPSLVVFDTLQTFLPEGVDMAKRKDMRDALNPLNQLGAKFGTAFLLIMHTNKSSNSGRQRMADSSDIWDLGRSALMAGRTKDKITCYISHEKCNYGRLQDTILFQVNENGSVEFRGTSKKKDADFVSEKMVAAPSPKRDEAKDFIIETLREAESEGIKVTVSDLARKAGEADITASTLKDAKAELKQEGMITIKHGGFSDKNYYISIAKK